MSGAQCAKRLWLEVRRPELAQVSADTERAFDRGHQVGAVARTLWPGGVLIGHDQQLSDAIRETQARLAGGNRVTLFEATLRANGVLVRTDILERDEAGATRLVEVKASTSVKPQYIPDCAIQAWVLQQLDLAPARIELAFVNNQFVYPGGGDYRGLLALEDITEKVSAWLPEVPRLIGSLRKALQGGEPAIGIGPHCHSPYPCPFFGYCGPPAAEFPLDALPGGGKVLTELARQGLRDIREIPPGTLKNETQEWARRVTVSGHPDLKPGAAKKLRALGWPRYYFDFETIGFAVPIWPGTRPYQPLPFQWSCHSERQDGTLAHREFLAAGDGPPMRACAEGLIAALGTEGPVLVYTDYEKKVLTDLAALCPDLAPALEKIIGRLFDLYPLTKAHYYHPEMRGSWSLKAVVPTIAPDINHATLEHVSVGSDAEAAFGELLNGAADAARREALRAALREYCRLDTLALVRLARHLSGGSP